MIELTLPALPERPVRISAAPKQHWLNIFSVSTDGESPFSKKETPSRPKRRKSGTVIFNGRRTRHGIGKTPKRTTRTFSVSPSKKISEQRQLPPKM
ncbi:Hypothetical protein NTJ_03050 [Nesidiocoris tenuis]|uniref:Uncharacterized protein n=1 Tax=Nesidiocoris tenuis TaxID=355587 RepID=A0ABN7AG60_9HEMI|nr:Hypothetical protein NTJ_03050 [Nesidiocoris tenuis]